MESFLCVNMKSALKNTLNGENHIHNGWNFKRFNKAGHKWLKMSVP